MDDLSVFARTRYSALCDCLGMESKIDPEAVDSLKEFEPGLGSQLGANLGAGAKPLLYPERRLPTPSGPWSGDEADAQDARVRVRVAFKPGHGLIQAGTTVASCDGTPLPRSLSSHWLPALAGSGRQPVD